MRLLVCTQKVDTNDPILGFFHRWIEEFAHKYELVTVIALGVGTYALPTNVRVFSLGKEKRASRLQYVFTFYRLVWRERRNYDAVFVHMNQEYVLLAGVLWRLLHKKVMLWRNHAKGNLFTRFAVLVSNKVFYTSPQSYTAQFKKSVRMPVGIDTNFFKPDPNVKRIPNSVLFLGRVSPVKKVLEFIDWVKENGYTATIAGPILSEDKEYGEKVKLHITHSLDMGGQANDEAQIKYVGSVNQEEARRLYQTHEMYANFTPAGSLDKTIIEAFVCGCKLEVRNPGVGDIDMEKQSLDDLLVKLQMEMT